MRYDDYQIPLMLSDYDKVRGTPEPVGIPK